MIIKKYYENNGNTVYRCDRCDAIIDTSEQTKYQLNISSSKSKGKNIYSYHLCRRCCRIIVNFIEKGLSK